MARRSPSSFKITPIQASPERLANHGININDSSSPLNGPGVVITHFALLSRHRDECEVVYSPNCDAAG